MSNANSIFIVGRLKRIDARFNKTKDGREFVSVAFTVNANENEIRVESFSMRYKKDGKELGSYEGLMTLINEAKCLHKTIRREGVEKPEIIEDETIVDNIEDADALDCGNYKVRYTRFEENSYEKEGQVVKNVRIQTTYPRRVDFEKVEYEPKADFAITGKVIQAPYETQLPNGDDVVRMVVRVPIYQEKWQDRPASVTLHDIPVETRDVNAFDYVLSSFEKNGIAYLEGSLLRTVENVKIEPEVDDTRGFGSCKYNKEPRYKNNIDEAFIIEGGYPLEVEEVELMDEFKEELWEVAEKEKDNDEGEKSPSMNKVWGKEKKKATVKEDDDVIPF